MVKAKREAVEHLTYFVVQPYKAAGKGKAGGISADDAIPADDEAHARRLVERFKDIRAGVVAFRRTGDPATGEWEDAVIIARHGIVSTEVDAMTDSSEEEFDSWGLGEGAFKVA